MPESKKNKIIAQNRKAFHDYDILEKFEAGIALYGAEVKAVRAGKVNLSDSYAQCSSGELFLNHLHISPYDHVSYSVPDPYRKRKLLLSKRQIMYLGNEVERKQLTIIPLSLYFRNQWVKVEIGLCRGRKKWDKRQKIAESESKRRMQKLLQRYH
ncbi:MAG: SsrA-binding protein SmpB [Chitinispirillaceae bacterium]|nr:SsrA-binding protein SmpB [Chitinispirillaceae bacterium]